MEAWIVAGIIAFGAYQMRFALMYSVAHALYGRAR